MSQHTPGPWEIETMGRARLMVCASEEQCGGYTIAEMNAAAPCREANARLIAAAPELLAALKRVLPFVPGYADQDHLGRPWLVDAIAAIAKAEGAS